VFARQRELNVLREQVAQALALEARQRPLFAAAAIPNAVPAQAGAPPASPAQAEARPAPTIYRARRRWRWRRTPR